MPATKLLPLAVALVAAPAFAHDAWLEPAPQGVVVRYGENGKAEPYRLDKVKALIAYDAAGKPLATTRSDAGDVVRFAVPEGAALLALAFDNGYWSKGDSGKTENVAMNANPGAKSGSWPMKYSKSVLRWTPRVVEPVGHRLELVPVSAEPPQAGKPMSFRVLFEGKPLANAKVSTGEEEPGPRTNGDGIASFTPKAGPNVVWTSMRRPVSGEPRFDSESVQVNFRFDAR